MNLYMVKTEGHDPLHLDLHFIVPLIMVQYLIVKVTESETVNEFIVINCN